MPWASSSVRPRACPEDATVENARIIPKMVPSRPIKGAIEAMTANTRRYLRSLNTSRSPACWTCFSSSSSGAPSRRMAALEDVGHRAAVGPAVIQGLLAIVVLLVQSCFDSVHKARRDHPMPA